MRQDNKAILKKVEIIVRGRGVLSIMATRGGSTRKGYLFRLQVYEKVGDFTS